MGETLDFFRGRLDSMIDLAHPLAVLGTRLPWAQIEAELAPIWRRQWRGGVVQQSLTADLFDLTSGAEGAEGGGVLIGEGVSAAGRPRLNVRLMVALLYLKHAFNLSDEALCERWSENVVWQHFSGMDYYEPRLPCDPTQIGRFRTMIGEAGMEAILKATIDTAIDCKAIKPTEFERLIVDTTVQEKAIAYPGDSRLLEIARYQVVKAAKGCGIALCQTFAKEGKTLRRKAGGYAHARQFKRLARAVKRQRTILGKLIREVRGKLAVGAVNIGVNPFSVPSPSSLSSLTTLLGRADRIRTQKKNDKNKLYALHAPEVECISTGKARNRYEFGVKVSLAVTHKQGLIVGAKRFPGNPFDGHTLAAQIGQTNALINTSGKAVTEAYVDLGYRGVDADNPGVRVIHRGRIKSMTKLERKRLKRRQAVEPVIGHVKHDHRMIRCHLIGSLGDALHAIACAAGYNIRWLMRAMLRLGLKGLFAPSFLWTWVMLTLRWSAIGAITRRSITAKASPVRQRHFPFVGAFAI